VTRHDRIDVTGVLRMQHDIGLLSNVRMGVEIAVGLAHLTGRRLSSSLDRPIPGAPRSSIPDRQLGRPASVNDLFELPVPIVHADEFADVDSARTETIDWPDVSTAVCVVDGEIDLDDPELLDFANGRTKFVRPPASDVPVVSITGRPLGFYSYFFRASPAVRRGLHAVLRGVRPRRPYVELASSIARDLGPHNAVHLRRSDLTIGIPAYGHVTPDVIAGNLAAQLDTDETLLVCSEVDAGDELFDPLRRRFRELVFANDLILGDHGERFFGLPRHEDNALGLVTQEIASRSGRFVGTIGSTFTAMIQRNRLVRDADEIFRFTADYTPPGPVFRNGEFVEIAEGCYSWNRLGYSMSPEVLSWFREWPESAW
jgi:hypothetical protein